MKVTTYPATPPATAGDDADVALNKAASSLHQVVDKAAWAADDAARTVAPAIDRAAVYAHQTVDKLASSAAPAAAWLDEQAENIEARRRTAIADAGEYVAAHPWKSIGFALAAGFFIGRILS